MEIRDVRMAAPDGIPCHNPRPMPAMTNGRDARHPRRLRSLAAVAATLAILLAACGSATPSNVAPSTAANPTATTMAPSIVPSAPPPSTAPKPLASQDLATVYRTIEDQVVQIRQLQPNRPISPTVLDGPGLHKLVADGFDKDNPPDVIAANQLVYQALGLLPKSASLKDLYVSMLGSQVAGLYNPDDKKLYVVSRSGKIGALEKATFSHEFTHALQDQNFDLGSLKLDEVGQGDRSFARLSLVEGDATLAMTDWELQNLTAADLGELLQQ